MLKKVTPDSNLGGREINASSIFASNNIITQDKVIAGEGILCKKDLIVNGKICMPDKNGVMKDLSVDIDPSINMKLRAVEKNYDDFMSLDEDILPHNTEKADVFSDDKDIAIKNSVDYNDEKSFYVDKMISAGAVTSVTGFVAENEHCEWDEEKQDYNKDENGERIYNKESTYILPNKVMTSTVQCKRIYSGDPKDDEIDIYCKKVKLSNKNDINLLETDHVDSNTLNVKKVLSSEEDTQLKGDINMQPEYFVEIKSDKNYEPDKMNIEEWDSTILDKEKPSLVVRGTIKCTKLIGEVSSTSSKLESLETGTISSNAEDGMLKLASPLDGIPPIQLASYEFDYSENYDGKFTPFLFFPRNKFSRSGDWKFKLAGKTIDLSPYLFEYEFMHGAYCSNHDIFKCMNMLYTTIVKETNPYLDNTKVEDDLTKTQYLLNKTCSISNAISISKDLINDADLYKRFKNLMSTYYATEKNHIKSINEGAYEVDLPCYNDQNTGSKLSSLAINLSEYYSKRNCTIMYRLTENNGDYTGSFYSILEDYDINEYVFQFLFFNFFKDFYMELITESGKTLTNNSYAGYDLVKATGIDLPNEDSKMVLSPGAFARFEHRLEPFELTPILEKFLWEGLKAYLRNTTTFDFGPLDVTKSLNIKMVEDKGINRTMGRYQFHKWMDNGIKSYNFGRVTHPFKSAITEVKGHNYTITTTRTTVGTLGVHEIDGDVEMNGDLYVSKIENHTGDGTNPLNIPFLNVNKFYHDGVEYTFDPLSAKSELGPMKYSQPLYFKNKEGKLDQYSQCDGRNAPLITMDLNYIGQVAFVGVRSFIIPGYLAQFYYPSSGFPHGAGAIDILPIVCSFKINPYNFPIYNNSDFTNTNPVICTKGLTYIEGKGNLTAISGYMNPENGYVVASTTARLYYTSNDEYSSDGTMKNVSLDERIFDIDFVVYPSDLSILHMLFRKNASECDSLQYPAEKKMTLLYMFVNGFRFTAVKADSTEMTITPDMYYNDGKKVNYKNGDIEYMSNEGLYKKQPIQYTELNNTYVISDNVNVYDFDTILAENNLTQKTNIAIYYEVYLKDENNKTLATVKPLYKKREIKLYISPSGGTNLIDMKKSTYKLYYSDATKTFIFETNGSPKMVNLSDIGKISELLELDTWNITTGGVYDLRLMKENYGAIIANTQSVDNATMEKIQITIVKQKST